MEIPICNTCNSSKPNSYVLVCTGCASKIKESQTTDTQQLKAKIRSVVDDFVCIPPVRIAQEIDNLIYKLRELSAV